MKKFICYLLGATALMLTSCQLMEESFTTCLTAYMESPAVSKTSLSPVGDQMYNVLWSEGDKIGVYIDDNTDPSTFTLVSGAGSGFAIFNGDGSGSSYLAFYPESMLAFRSGNIINITVPEEQAYAPDTFDAGTFPMVAVSDSPELSFYNLSSIIRISLTGTETVSKIVFRPNDPAVKVSGAASVDVSDPGNPVITMAEDACDSLILNTGGVQLSGRATDFYLVLPPQTYTGGFTVRVYSGDDYIEKSYQSDITLRRSSLRRASVFSYGENLTVNKYLTFTSEGETTVRLDNAGANAPLLYYSTDAENWTQWDYSDLTFTSESPLYICGDNPDGLNSYYKYSRFIASGSLFGISGDIMSLLDCVNDMDVIPNDYCFHMLFLDCWMLKSAPDLSATTLTPFCYQEMFKRCLNLVSAPALPATTLAMYCYSDMFRDCESLTTASEMSATTLADLCCGSMYSGCTSLTEVPALPATTLAPYCYSNMFSGCTSLTATPALPATELDRFCYYEMFNGCTSLATVQETLPATTLAESCYDTMFSGCESLTAAPALPATTLAPACYYSMFYGCTSLVSAPELSAPTLDTYCYASMFYGCSSLNYVECYATDIDYTEAVSYWLYGVADTGTFVKAGSMEDWPAGDSGIPEGWTVQSDGAMPISASKYLTFTSEGTTTISLENIGGNRPLLYYSTDATSWTEWDYSELSFSDGAPLYICGSNSEGFSHGYIKFSKFAASGDDFSISGDIMSLIDRDLDVYDIPCDYCFVFLFQGCRGLIAAPELPATSLTEYCYSNMFSGCTGLSSAPALPATTIANYCYQGMFSGCTGLTAAPALPATTLGTACYYAMFSGCTSLATAPVLPATALTESCYMEMFRGCTSLTSAPEIAAATMAINSCESMFNGCTSLSYVKCLATDIGAAYCVEDWLKDVADSGTFVKAASMESWPTGPSGIPDWWDVVNDGDSPSGENEGTDDEDW